MRLPPSHGTQPLPAPLPAASLGANLPLVVFQFPCLHFRTAANSAAHFPLAARLPFSGGDEEEGGGVGRTKVLAIVSLSQAADNGTRREILLVR